jgi:hypothetical protein
MTCPHAVEALTKQRDRLVEVLRLIDDGRWWTGDDACRIDEDEVCLQADRIGAALNVVERLANEMAAEDGSGVGSQVTTKAKDATPGHSHQASADRALPEGLGPHSPGKVGPVHDVIHEAGGYEQRSWGLSGGVPKLT